MSPQAGENLSSRGNCPSCDRFIGPVAACPYCGAAATGNKLLPWMRRAALLLGTAGVAFLYLMAADRPIPHIQMGSITPMMNFARVRVSGEVTGRPYVSPGRGDAEYVSFVVHDDTGNVRIKAWGDAAQALLSQGLVPDSGVTVTAQGQLRVVAGKMPSLFLSSVSHLGTMNGKQD